ncbi:MAG: acyltransferase [Bdellovibrionaceae bacterium]|nr:acyltransferase [Pseudobdellovibrionaceae bacterium]
MRFQKHKQFGVHLFIFTLGLSYLGPTFFNSDHSQYRDIAYHWSVIKYLFCFSFGLVLFDFQKRYRQHFPKFTGLVFVQLIFLLICFNYTNLSRVEEFVALWTGAVIVTISSRSTLTKFVFENNFILFMGTVSYSFYLIHYPVLMYIDQLELGETTSFIFGLALTLIFSAMTFKLVEEPSVKFAKTITELFRKS